MHDSYLFLTPILTLLVVALVGFVGCDAVFGLQHVPDPVVPPANLAGVPGDGKVDLTWDAAPKADKYTVKRGLTSGSYTDAHDVGTNTSYTDPMLTNGTTYYYVVTATVSSSESSPSNEVSAVPGLYGVMTNFIASKTLGTPRNFNGQMGMGFTVAGKNLQVVRLGRAFVPGNSGIHKVRIIDAATKQEIASADVNVAGGVSGQFAYADVTPSIILNAGANYYVLSDESSTGDQFFDADTSVTTTAAASREFAVYGDFAGNYTEAPVNNHAYGPLDFVYIEQ